MTAEDVAYYIISRYNASLEQNRIEQFKTNHNIYTLAGLIYRFIGTLFSKNANVPKYEEIFERDDKEEIITEDNAFAYLIRNNKQDKKEGGES